MKYLFFVFLMAGQILATGKEPDLSLFSRIMTDDVAGLKATGGYLLNTGKKNLVKQLSLPCEPATLKQAMLEYEMSQPPYDTKQKKSVADPKHPWSLLKVRVNEVTVLAAPAGPYVGKGWHWLPLPVGALKAGDNRIEFIWSDRSGATGYLYFAFDQTAAEKAVMKKIPPRERSLPQRQLRIRLLVQ